MEEPRPALCRAGLLSANEKSWHSERGTSEESTRPWQVPRPRPRSHPCCHSALRAPRWMNTQRYRLPEGGAAQSIPCRIFGADRRTCCPVLDHCPRAVFFPMLRGLRAAPPSGPGHLLPIAIGWMICPGELPRPTSYDPACPKKPRCGPLAGSILSTKDLWHPAHPIRSASGRRIRGHPALPTSPTVFWGRCEPRRAVGAPARGQPNRRSALKDRERAGPCTPATRFFGRRHYVTGWIEPAPASE